MQKILNKLQTLKGNAIAKGSAVVFIGSMGGNIGAYLYHLVIGRILGPVGYGELSSLISLLYIFGVPNLVLQTVLVKYFSICKANGAVGQARNLFERVNKTVILLLLGTGIIFLGLSPAVSSFLRLSDSSLMIAVFFILAISTLTNINLGILQGFQIFIWFGVFSALGMLLRLGISIPLAYYGVPATLIASLIAATITYLLTYVPIRFLFSVPSKHFDMTKKAIITYSIPTLLALVGFTSIYSMDIVLVKHFFSSEDAGIYAAVAVLGKIIFYATSAVSLVVFPMLSERTERKEKTESMVWYALGMVLVSSLLLAAAYNVLPLTITRLLFGMAYDKAAIYLGPFSFFIASFSVANLLMYTSLAVGLTSVWIFLVAAAGIQIGLISVFHGTLSTVISVNTGVSIALSTALLIYYVLKRKHADYI